MIAVLGDIHGYFPILQQYTREYDLKDTHFILAGDCGVGFKTFKDDVNVYDYFNKMLKLNNNHLYLVRGNHDMPAYFMKNPEQILNSVKDYPEKLGLESNLSLSSIQQKFIDVKESFSNVHFVEDYTILNLEDKNILCIGGAVSVDRGIRTAGKSYWTDEVVVYNEEFLKNTQNINHVITHNAPTFANPTSKGTIVESYAIHDSTLIKDLNAERQLLTKIYHDLTFNGNEIESWIYGHFHSSSRMEWGNTKFILLGISELYEIR